MYGDSFNANYISLGANATFKLVIYVALFFTLIRVAQAKFELKYLQAYVPIAPALTILACEPMPH